jgi:hypothetical protein
MPPSFVALTRIGYRERMTAPLKKTMNDALRKVVKRLHCPLDAHGADEDIGDVIDGLFSCSWIRRTARA